jgi:DNA-binding transcriptional MocR family regulator
MSENTKVILRKFLNQNGLTVYERLLYTALFVLANGERQCCPSTARLAKLCGCSERQVERALNSLEEKNLISREARYGGTGMGGFSRQTNLFSIFPSDTALARESGR